MTRQKIHTVPSLEKGKVRLPQCILGTYLNVDDFDFVTDG